jgi:uncharacterized protein (TIGR02301 family)
MTLPVTLAVVLALAQGAVAGTAKPTPSPTPSPAPTRPEAAPYEADLLRLAELMGALSYLRDLCHDGDGQKFRDSLARLIEADTRAAEAKEQMAGAFNRGLEGYRLTYRLCTSNARAAIDAYLEETQRLAKDVAARYGG